MTKSASDALAILRDGSLFQWHVIPLFALVVYVYAREVEQRNWNAVFAGLAFWGMDWINEIINGLILHFTQYAPVWGTPGNTAYLILVGLNIEIAFMFSIAGIVFSKFLLPNREDRILHIPNRIFVAVVGSVLCVFIEYGLNAVGALTWEYSWWNRSAPYLIFLLGYLTFFLMGFWVYDLPTIKQKIRVVGTIYTIVILGLVVFMGILKWI